MGGSVAMEAPPQSVSNGLLKNLKPDPFCYCPFATASSAEETASASEELSAQAEELRGTVRALQSIVSKSKDDATQGATDDRHFIHHESTEPEKPAPKNAPPKAKEPTRGKKTAGDEFWSS